MEATTTKMIAQYTKPGETIDLFWTDEATGERYELDAIDMESILPFSWTLEGTINEAGEWCWDGEGDPKDCRFNTVTRIKAFHAETD